MITRGRVLGALGVLVLIAVLFTLWEVYRVEHALSQAQDDVSALDAAAHSNDTSAADRAAASLSGHAATAADVTSGWWWGAVTHVPLVGDDATGIRTLSGSLRLVSTQGVEPLVGVIDRLSTISTDGRIDLGAVQQLQNPVDQASSAFTTAAASVDDVDSDSYVGVLRQKFDTFRSKVDSAADVLRSARTAVRVLPAMAGGQGPRNYLLLFQNNAEIRATGGVPGSWALLHADHGMLRLTKQGSDNDFPVATSPVVPLTKQERRVYDGDTIARYWQDPGFTPDFPRAARIWQAFFKLRYPQTKLDGVLSLDPVALSYLMTGTGPVTVDGQQLSAETLVPTVLNQAYATQTPAQQDVYFQHVATAIFDAITGDLASPLGFVDGLARAGREGRFLVAPFEAADARDLSGQRVLGALTGDAGFTPHVDIGLNDATGSKMSYYLRYHGDVRPMSCTGDRQSLAGSMTLSQAISPGEAAKLSDTITGGGTYGTPPGQQLVVARLYGPYGGTIGTVLVDGKKVFAERGTIAGRPVATVPIQFTSTNDVQMTWSMTTGVNETGPGVLGMTPSVVPGDENGSFPSAC